MSTRQLAENWKDIGSQFLKIGATAYGGPAIMGIMQAELQEKRQWVTKERFVEGLSLVNMLPGATAAQLSIFLGYSRGGWWGGLLGGLCFVLPGFFVLLVLTMGYAALGVTPVLRGALYGLGPVVLGIYLVAVYRLSKAAMSSRSQSADRPRGGRRRARRSGRRSRHPAPRGRRRALAFSLEKAWRGGPRIARGLSCRRAPRRAIGVHSRRSRRSR